MLSGIIEMRVSYDMDTVFQHVYDTKYKYII